MSTEISIVKEKWAAFGVATQNTEITLANLKEKADKVLTLDVSKETVLDAETALKEAKSVLRESIDTRKALTSKLDAVSSRLMGYEKAITESIKTFEPKIIQVKRQLEAEKQAKEREIQDRKNDQLQADNAVAQVEYVNSQIVSKVILDCYSTALENPPKDLSKYIKKTAELAINSLTNQPTFKSKYPETVIKPIQKPSYLDVLHEVNMKFSTFEFDLQNKEQALKAAQEADKLAKEKAEAEKAQAEALAQIESQSTQVELFDNSVKALKKVYKVEMAETYENAMIILAAFMSNKEKCKAKTTASKWFAFNANSAATALAKVKNDDNSFSPSGILFIEVDKL